jgi:tRNA(adenine34) deaminase
MNVETLDQMMMARCIELAKSSGKTGEYPYAAVMCRDGVVVAESINRVRLDGDVTRHAEAVAISQAQTALRTMSLDDCDIYINGEPCALCSYAIRESRIRRVIFGLSSPHMGGVSKWNILADTDLSATMPEVFAPPPEIRAGYMAKEAQEALIEWNPLIATIILKRGLFRMLPRSADQFVVRHNGAREFLLHFLRQHVFDHFGRRKR